jgi:hypothetical protein
MRHIWPPTDAAVAVLYHEVHVTVVLALYAGSE